MGPHHCARVHQDWECYHVGNTGNKITHGVFIPMPYVAFQIVNVQGLIPLKVNSTVHSVSMTGVKKSYVSTALATRTVCLFRWMYARVTGLCKLLPNLIMTLRVKGWPVLVFALSRRWLERPVDAGTGSPTLLAYHTVPGVPPVTRVNSERGSMSISSAVVGHPNTMMKNEMKKKTASYIAKRKEVTPTYYSW